MQIFSPTTKLGRLMILIGLARLGLVKRFLENPRCRNERFGFSVLFSGFVLAGPGSISSFPWPIVGQNQPGLAWVGH
jgi:hypothetical protein